MRNKASPPQSPQRGFGAMFHCGRYGRLQTIAGVFPCSSVILHLASFHVQVISLFTSLVLHIHRKKKKKAPLFRVPRGEVIRTA